VRLPPLRERREDVQLLADHFLREICEAEGQLKRFAPAAYAALQAHDWPGNVRELRNVVQRAYVMARDSVITDSWLELGSTKAARQEDVPLLSISVGTSIAEAERALILATLEHYEGQKERTAAVLGVSLKTLYNRLKEYSVDLPPSNGTAEPTPPHGVLLQCPDPEPAVAFARSVVLPGTRLAGLTHGRR